MATTSTPSSVITQGAIGKGLEKIIAALAFLGGNRA
jgi:hypothetical protein